MLITTTPATAYPVTLTEAKTQIGIDASETGFDTQITGLIAAATANAEAVTKLRLMPQVVQLLVPHFPGSSVTSRALEDAGNDCREVVPSHCARRGALDLIAAPVKTVDAVAYTDENGSAQTLTGGGVGYWALGMAQGTLYPFLVPEFVEGWPATQKGKPDAVTITMTVGYDSAADIPGDIKIAILMRVHELFDNRGETTAGTIIAKNLNSMTTMLAPHCRVRAG